MARIVQKNRADRARVGTQGLLPELFLRDLPTLVSIGNWFSLSDIHIVYI